MGHVLCAFNLEEGQKAKSMREEHGSRKTEAVK